MTQPPRILVLFGNAVIFGAERGNLEALMALRDQGAQILCLVRDESWSIVVPRMLVARAIPYRKVPYVEAWRRSRAHVVLLRGPFAFIVANWRFLRAIHEFKPTHIHTYSQLFVLNFLIGLMLVRTPLVFRAGDEPTTHNCVWRAAWRYVVDRTSQFVANSNFVARSLVSHGVTSGRITIIYNAPPTRTESREDEFAVIPPFQGQVIAFIGQIAEHKGTHLLIEAFKQIASAFPAARLVLAGRISDWEGDAWARALRDAALADPTIAARVHFLGLIEDVPGLLSRCSFAVVPSLFADPSPNVVMEAKLAGRAVIGFPRGGIPELIVHGVDGWVCAEPTVAALRAAMAAYLGDENLARVHGVAARQSLERLGIPNFRQKWLEVYEVATRSKRPE